MGLSDVRQLDFTSVHDKRGNLSVIEGGINLPYEIARVYYLYDVPTGSMRGGHAHTLIEQTLIALSGSFDVTLDDGREEQTYHLSRPDVGLYVPTYIWREINNFSSGSVCLVLASEHYDESEYLRNYREFLKQVRKR